MAHLRSIRILARICTPPGRGCALNNIPVEGWGGQGYKLNSLSRVVLNLSRRMCACICGIARGHAYAMASAVMLCADCAGMTVIIHAVRGSPA